MEELENELNQIDLLNNWNDKYIKLKELKSKISEEQENIKDLIEKINNDEPIYEIKKKKLKGLDLNELIDNFNNSDNLEEKIKYYDMINYYIKDMESQLFELTT